MHIQNEYSLYISKQDNKIGATLTAAVDYI